MSSGSLMPSRCRGLSSGSSSHTHRTIVPRFCFSSAPPMPNPSKPVRRGHASRSRVACRRRSSYCAPWTTANSAWYGRPGPLRGQPPVLGQAPLRPRVGALHRPLLVAAGVHQRGAFVEREDDVRAELVLDPHRDLRREPVHRTVQVRLERHPVVVDGGQPVLAGRDDVVGLHPVDVHRQHLLEPDAQRQHLEAAGVGERRPRPVHERAETAAPARRCPGRAAGTGGRRWPAPPARPGRPSTPAARDLTVALVPTAMNAGVRMSPCGVLITPVRPVPPGSRLPTSNPNPAPAPVVVTDASNQVNRSRGICGGRARLRQASPRGKAPRWTDPCPATAPHPRSGPGSRRSHGMRRLVRTARGLRVFAVLLGVAIATGRTSNQRSPPVRAGLLPCWKSAG